MPLVLRLDIDKPYGRANIREKLLSKFAEDVFEYKSTGLGFLDHLPDFFDTLDQFRISSFVYFRNCSLPTTKLFRRLESRGDVIGFHAEDTRNEETFLSELEEFSRKLSVDVKDFTKHGSGTYKLGKRHHAPYEEKKYLEWAKRNNLNYYFGNGMCTDSSQFEKSTFYPDMFWIEPHYRNTSKFNIDWLKENVKHKIIPVITHPENIYAESATALEFKAILENLAGDFISPADFKKDFLLSL